MADPAPTADVVDALLARHGTTYAAAAGIRIRNTPAPLWQLLVLALLLSARIRAAVGVAAARALFEAGWTTPHKLAASTWADRTSVLNHAGYARYDESTSTMLHDTASRLLDRYHGDLRQLRDEAGRDPAEERRLLQQFKGIGPAGASIFAREVQAVWDEVCPYADDRALRAADALGLGADAGDLRRLVSGPSELARLVAALVRCDLAGDADEVRAQAGSRPPGQSS